MKSSYDIRSRIERLVLLTILLAAAPALVHAQSESIMFSELNMDDGLSQNSVYSMIQDNRGFMWFGTQDGLNRFDGYTFKVYNHDPDRDDGLLGSRVWSAYEDEFGGLWFGSDAGLNRYYPVSDNFKRFANDPDDPGSLVGNIAFALHGSGDGYLWVGTGNGVSRLDLTTDEFTHYRHDPSDTDSLSDNNITSLFADADGFVWIGTKRGGLNRLDTRTEEITHVQTKTDTMDGVPSMEVTSLLVDHEEMLWIGTAKGLSRYDIANDTFKHFYADADNSRALPNNIISALFEDSLNTLWVATEDGLCAYDRATETFTRYQHSPGDPNSLSYNHVFSVYESSEGILWAGTEASGVNKGTRTAFFAHHKYDPFKQNGSLADPIVWSIYDAGDTLWAGTHKGVSMLDKVSGTYRYYVHEPNDDMSLSHNRVNAIYKDPDGYMWFGTKDGLDKLDPATNTFSHTRSDPNDAHTISDNNIRIIMEDSRGDVWLGTNDGGVNKIDLASGRVERHEYDPNSANSVSHFRIRALVEDSKGNIWIGSYGGVDMLNPATDEIFNYGYSPSDQKGLNAQIVFSVHEDRQGYVWIGTKGGGVNRLDPATGTFSYYTVNDGLPNNVVYDILEDENGYLWVSTNRGISRFHIYSGDRLIFKNFHKEDGLQDSEFNANSRFHNQETGEMFFGGINGFNSFFPAAVDRDDSRPRVYITDFKVFNQSVGAGSSYQPSVSNAKPQRYRDKEVSESEEVVLSYKENAFSFEFVALHYAVPERNQYAYMLEGFDKDWIQSGTRRFASYTNLGAGEYRFRVRGASHNDVWSEEGVSVRISITPPVWHTWWFRTATFTIFVLFVFAIYSWRLRAIRARNKALKNEVELRTVELEEQKSNLESTLDELHETKDALIESAHKAGMADTAAGVLHNIGNILNSVNTAANLMHQVIGRSVINRFVKANGLLRANIGNVEAFMTHGDEGKKLMNYYLAMEEPFLDEHKELQENSDRLMQRVSAINDAIASQQLYAVGHKLEEDLSLEELLEEVLQMQSSSIEKHGITVEKKFSKVPKCRVQKSKFLQIFLNLYKNAKQSMEGMVAAEKVISIELYQEGSMAIIKVTDTGLGIAADKTDEIFSYGFTTKSDGHGIGLHSCANYMTEMKGKIWAQSAGLGQGATITVQFSLDHEKS